MRIKRDQRPLYHRFLPKRPCIRTEEGLIIKTFQPVRHGFRRLDQHDIIDLQRLGQGSDRLRPDPGLVARRIGPVGQLKRDFPTAQLRRAILTGVAHHHQGDVIINKNHHRRVPAFGRCFGVTGQGFFQLPLVRVKLANGPAPALTFIKRLQPLNDHCVGNRLNFRVKGGANRITAGLDRVRAVAINHLAADLLTEIGRIGTVNA